MSRYDWSKIPQKYKWAATDSDGVVAWYIRQPKRTERQWYPKSNWWREFLFRDFGSEFEVDVDSCGGGICPDWRESLEERP